jgi:hypothetical protein
VRLSETRLARGEAIATEHWGWGCAWDPGYLPNPILFRTSVACKAGGFAPSQRPRLADRANNPIQPRQNVLS